MTTPFPMVADLYCDVPSGDAQFRWKEYLPGVAVVGIGTLAAGFLADHYRVPLTLMALLIGLALNFLSADLRLAPGLRLAAGPVLRGGIVLLGVRVTLGQMLALGPTALVCLLVIVGLTIATGILAARRLGFDTAFGTLAGGAVAICGASAAMALAATLGERRVSQSQLTLVLVGISAMSATAMVLYPGVLHVLKMNDIQAGFTLGAAIHDVAQALGAGYSYSRNAGDIAAIVKLTRVALLAPVLGLIVVFLPKGTRRGGGVRGQWFVLGFFLVAAINSTGMIPGIICRTAEMAATALLACAVTATAIRAPLAPLVEAGAKPLLVILIATLAAFVLALIAAFTLI